MKYQMIIDKLEFDKEIQEAETRGYWKAVNQLSEDKGCYKFGRDVGSYQEETWLKLIQDIRLGRKHGRS